MDTKTCYIQRNTSQNCWILADGTQTCNSEIKSGIDFILKREECAAAPPTPTKPVVGAVTAVKMQAKATVR